MVKPAHGLDAVLHSVAACEAHVRSEYVHDLAGTMATVSSWPHYAVTAAPGVSWTDLEPLVLETLLDHFVTGAPLFAPGSAAAIRVDADFEEDPADADIVDQIKELIETRVRPAVAQDGGDIVYKGYRDGHLYLSMHGACAGCPSSTITLKRGIESLIRHYVPEVESVEAV